MFKKFAAMTAISAALVAIPATANAYTVKAGDTLTAIARHNGTTTSKLASYNHISNPNLIFVGQNIAIPGKTTTPVKTSPKKTTTTTKSSPGVISTSYGAHYDPSKCTPAHTYWKGHRRFYLNTTQDYGCFTSPWFPGVHPVMLSFGHTIAPWYPSNHAHHGIDIDMAMGTPIRSDVSGRVYVNPASMGSAYGTHALLLRSGGYDYILGHMSKLAVSNGQYVSKGQLLGYSGMSGAEDEDGPHFHFEKRPAGTGYLSAVDPHGSLELKRV